MILTLPTRKKEKLPAGFAYPVWPSVVTEAFRELPQVDDMELVFRWRDQFHASRWSERIERDGEITLVSAEYHHQHHSPYFPRWKITVHSVPEHALGPVREFLRGRGLEDLASRVSEHAATPDYAVKETLKFHLGSVERSGFSEPAEIISVLA